MPLLLPLSDDPEEVHAWRVTLPRLRVVLRLCSDALPPAGALLQRRLRDVAGLLAEVRDLDVLATQVAAWQREATPSDGDAYAGLRRLLVEARAAARDRMAQELAAPQPREIATALGTLVAAGTPPDVPAARRTLIGMAAVLLGIAPAVMGDAMVAAAPTNLKHWWRSIRKAGAALPRRASATALHQLRIRVKRLRDALDLLADRYGPAADPLRRRLATLHDLLGRHQDAHVAATILRRLRQTNQGELTPAESILLKVLARRYDRQAADAQAQVHRAYRSLKGKLWRRLRRALSTPQQRLVADGFGLTGRRQQLVDVYLVRHAGAYPRDLVAWPDDRERPLTPRGKNRFRAAARGLRRLTPEVTLVLSSPLTRAWQTSRVLEQEARWPKAISSEALATEGTPEAVIEVLRGLLMGDERPCIAPLPAGRAEEPPGMERLEEAAPMRHDERKAATAGHEPGIEPGNEGEKAPNEQGEDEREDHSAPGTLAHMAVAVVGHELNLHHLASYLLTGDAARIQLALKKGGVACLSLPYGFQPGTATLRWVLPPKVLRAVGL